MDKKKIVVISGKQFSGKDTVANMLMELLDDFRLAPLAGAIKIEFGEEKDLTLNEIERNKPLYRAELIELGNRRRSEDRNYWIKKVLSQSGNIIVPDLRLQYELETFRKQDAVTIRVESDRSSRGERGKLVKEDDATETDLDNVKDWNFVVKNDGTLEDLRKKANKIAKQIEKEFSKQLV